MKLAEIQIVQDDQLESRQVFIQLGGVTGHIVFGLSERTQKVCVSANGVLRQVKQLGALQLNGTFERNLTEAFGNQPAGHAGDAGRLDTGVYAEHVRSGIQNHRTGAERLAFRRKFDGTARRQRRTNSQIDGNLFSCVSRVRHRQ